MALNATQQWWVRADGAETNGGGFDAAVAGAGTNYSDQAAPQLSITDLTSTASTTVTSALSTFTSAMVGNILRLASGAGTTVGYYMIVAYVSASQVTLDRVSGTYTAGVAKVGGAHASLVNYSSTSGGLPTPAIATPLAAGHQVNIRGAGSDAPSSSDYNYSAGYWTFPAGTTANGRIRWIGYNGRPRFTIDGMLFYVVDGHYFENLFGFFEASPGYTDYGFVYSAGSAGTIGTVCNNVRVDLNGNDAQGLYIDNALKCELLNSGGGAAGTKTGIVTPNYVPGNVQGNYVHGLRGAGIFTPGFTTVRNNLVTGCGSHGIVCTVLNAQYATDIQHNTVHGNGGDGIRLTNAASISAMVVANNLLTSNGGYGIDAVAGAATLNDKLIRWLGNNAMRSNTSGAYANLTAPATDVTLTGDPYVDAAGGNFALNATAGAGAAARAAGYPGAFPLALTTGYLDVGAVQHADPASGGLLRHPGMRGGLNA